MWLGQLEMGRDPAAEDRPHAALEATVRILAFTLKDTGSHGRVWAEKSYEFTQL